MDLVGDVGGTWSRFALVKDGALSKASVKALRNDDYATFDAALAGYLVQSGTLRVSRVVLALAGPVTGRSVRMTNRDWVVDAGAIGDQVLLMNDVEALGRAIPALGANQIAAVYAGTPEGPGQALMIALGTGANISPVRVIDGKAVAFEAEFGHAALPKTVGDAITAWIGTKSVGFETAEDLFSGPGLTRLSQILGVSDVLKDTEAAREFGALFGILLRELAVTLLPRRGIYVAGSVGRAIFDGPAADGFTRTFGAAFVGATGIGSVRVWSVRDDAAALWGCVAALQ